MLEVENSDPTLTKWQHPQATASSTFALQLYLSSAMESLREDRVVIS
jgi:hypothetical protein